MRKIQVPYIDQSIKYPTGCESVSAVMLLKYLGYEITVSTGKTTRSITVGLDDVDSQARYMLEFSVDGSVVTNAYFTVRDLSDPLEIVIDQPVDAMIGSGDSLTYTAVVRRVGTTDNLTGYTFNYTLLKLDGTEISSGVATGGKFTITGQQLLDNEGTINWSVTAKK